MKQKSYPLRLKAACAGGGAAPATVRSYAKKGLIDAERDSNGNWMFSLDAPAQIRAIRQSNMKSAASA